jgi:hypothetical protein
MYKQTCTYRGIVLRDDDTLYNIKAHLWPKDSAFPGEKPIEPVLRYLHMYTYIYNIS